jgi:hypothetical protein
MLGYVKIWSGDFREFYTLWTLYVSLVRPKLEYASYVWRRCFDVHMSRIEHMQRKFVGNALQGLEWTDKYDVL